MLSAVMKAASRCVMAPASPQCGRKRNVFIPRCLSTRKEDSEQVNRVRWHVLQYPLTSGPAQPLPVCPTITQLDLRAHYLLFLCCACNEHISAILMFLHPSPSHLLLRSVWKLLWDMKLQTTLVAEQGGPLPPSASPSGRSLSRSWASPA